MHSTGFEKPKSSEKKRESQTGRRGLNNQQMDSIFNRVFGHHSSESSRSGSPTPPSIVKPAPKIEEPQQPIPTSSNPKDLLSDTSPSANIPFLSVTALMTTTERNLIPRRLSYDGHTDSNSLKPKPMPTASASARVGAMQLNQGMKNSSLLYPREGLLIGSNDNDYRNIRKDSLNGLHSSSTSEKLLHINSEHPHKKKSIFSRVRSKYHLASSSASIASSNYNPSIDSGTLLLPKKSTQESGHIKMNKFLNQKGKKKSKLSSAKKGKLNNMETSFDMSLQPEEFLNPNYQKEDTSSLLLSTNGEIVNWTSPESWEVDNNEAESSSEEDSDSDMDDNSEIRFKIFRPDKTYNTLHMPLKSKIPDIIEKAVSKTVRKDEGEKRERKREKREKKVHYFLAIEYKKNVRVLRNGELPLMIQKRLQKRMGIVKSDLNSDISYIVKFILAEHLSELPNYFQKKLNAQNGIFKAEYCSLPKIPVFLHKLAPKIIELNISGNSKMKIAGDFLQTCQYLKILTVENNEYSKIRISFAEVPSLKYLNISKNKIKNLKNGNLERIPNLRSLDLSNNKISEIPQSFNKGFRQLTSLNISGNRLTTFPRLICNIVSLTHLDISFNRIGELPLEIGQLANLIELYAIASHIQGTLPASFIQLTKLTTLDIRQNFITALNVVFDLPALEVLLVDYNSTGVINFEIKNLKVLKMYRNHLTQFSLRNIRGGQSLTTLNLSNCKLSSLPEDLFENIQGLESLVLDSNTLSMLPPSIVVLQKLATLSVQNNHLEALPDAIGKLTSLTYLYAQKNNMKTLPVEIWNCISLKTLNCSSNLLGSFPEPCLLEDTAANIKLIPQKNVRQGLIKHLGASYQDATLLLDTPQTSFVSNSLNFNSKETLENSGHPVFPLTLVLSALFLGDNQLTDDVWVPVSYLKSLRLLNLSFNDIYEIPSGNLCPILHELYLSGNNFTFLPGDFLKSLSYLRILVVSANKLQTLPHEITKLRKLEVLDVGNNLLNYNLTNSSYDWNWNENELLKYLNFSGNKRLTILRVSKPKDRLEENDTSYFSVLKKLRTVGLIDNTVHDIHSLSQSCNLRVRTTEREVSNMSYGVADWLGQSSHLSTWDFTSSKFSEKGDGSLFAIFDPVFQTFRTQTEKQQLSWGCNLTWKLKEKLESMFIAELLLVGPEFTINSAIRRVFYNLEHYISSEPTIEKDLGASVALCYISGTKLYVANVGDVMVVMSRNNGQVFEIAQNHLPLNPSEASRVRNSEGYISKSGLLNDRLSVSRCLGHFQHAPAVNCDPFVQDINLSENDEFVIMASKGLWNTMSYQTAVDIARTEKGDLMLAAQKLRDFALSYGSTENIMVMIIGVSDLFSKSDKQTKKSYMGSDGTIEGVMLAKSAKRRGKEEVPGDSTLARLEKEVAPPVSQLALVFTDVKNSTQFWETQPENMRSAIKLHDAIMRRTLRNIGGYEVKTEGDAFMVCFKNVTAALLWCFTVQTLLLEADWPAGITKSDEGKLSQDSDNVVLYKGLSVRMGIHCGTPVSERNPITQRMDYFGPVVNKASRICNVADGGEICISSDVISVLKLFPCFFNDSVEIEEILGDDGGPYSIASNLRLLRTFGHHIVPLGKVQLKGLETPENLSLIYPKKLEGREMLKKKIETSSKLLVNEQISPELQAREQKSPDNFTGEQSPFEASFLKQNLLQRQPMDRNSSEKSITDIPLPFKQCLSDGMPIGTVTTADIISSLPADHISAQPTARNALRIIDPAVVCALNSIAFRLERLTSGYYSSQHSSEHTFEDPSIIRKLKYENFEQTSIGLTMDKYLREQATDEELIRTMENCVSRIENSASSLFVQKIGRFSNVLERLSEAVELDPLYILKALQMYAESFPK